MAGKPAGRTSPNGPSGRDAHASHTTATELVVRPHCRGRQAVRRPTAGRLALRRESSGYLHRSLFGVDTLFLALHSGGGNWSKDGPSNARSVALTCGNPAQQTPTRRGGPAVVRTRGPPSAKRIPLRGTGRACVCCRWAPSGVVGEGFDDSLSRCSRRRCDFSASRDADNAPPAHLVAPGCEPAVDPFGDCLPSGLKHYVVSHVREELGRSLVSQGSG
jgi:hypothetical protein